MADHFDERSGVVPCKTSWGSWAQTIDEIFIEVDLPEGTRGKDVKCVIKPTHISCVVKGNEVFKGEMGGKVLPNDSTWTIEDKKLLRIVLVKSGRDAANCWKSLLSDQYLADPWVFNEMEKKLTLERFQKENPGFDFSGAEVTGNYSGGGPKFPSYS
ncbi:nudC domain-containing protein 2 [Nematostella vectensis]|uniref:nudC domain-containing protein 2 n=1 Tax=Nematostella vectensis TaxID=45351 RepID=UPI0020774436|nr:nudC domain-containing protein 2 [Nematostella vectensis]